MTQGKSGPVGVRNTEKLAAVISYVSVGVFFSLFRYKDNTFVRFHVKQSLVLFVFECTALIMQCIPVIGDVCSVFIFVMCLLFSLIGMAKAYLGEQWEMPGIFDIVEAIPLINKL